MDIFLWELSALERSQQTQGAPAQRRVLLCVCECARMFFNSSKQLSLVFPILHYGLWMNKHKDIQATLKKKTTHLYHIQSLSTVLALWSPMLGYLPNN